LINHTSNFLFKKPKIDKIDIFTPISFDKDVANGQSSLLCLKIFIILKINNKVSDLND
jgi:hypothetical protein